MTALQRRNPGSGELRGVSGMSAGGRTFVDKNAIALERLQFRHSAFALAIDAITPEIAWLESMVQLTKLGMPLPGDGQQRLNRLALRLFDARTVLEQARPEARG